MSPASRAIIVLAFLHVAIAAAAVGIAGPLDPPAGAIAPTPGPEPRTAINAANTPAGANSLFRISQPGSYYLAGNITGQSGKHGIEIAASGVTIDLNGFELIGVPGSLEGIRANVASLRNLEVRDGSVRNWGSIGIDLWSANPSNVVIRGVRSSDNAGTGIAVADGLVVDCTAAFNTGDGIHMSESGVVTNVRAGNNGLNGVACDFGCTITNAVATLNGFDGIALSSGCVATACVAYNNEQHGISAATGNAISGCSSRNNGLDGIRVSGSCLVTGNISSSNGDNPTGGAGIHATSTDNRIEGNTCTSQERGIDVDGAGSVIVRNICSGNATNWTIAANNVCGPIINRTSPASAAISGDSAPSSLGSTDANANYTY